MTMTKDKEISLLKKIVVALVVVCILEFAGGMWALSKLRHVLTTGIEVTNARTEEIKDYIKSDKTLLNKMTEFDERRKAAEKELEECRASKGKP